MDNTIARLIMQGALDLLQSRSTWTRGALARGAGSNECDPLDSAARRWCAEGALQKSACELGFDEDDALHFVEHISEVCTDRSNGLMMINDGNGYKAVMSKLRGGLADLGGEVATPMPPTVVGALTRLAELGRAPAKAVAPSRVRRKALPECLNPAAVPMESVCIEEHGHSPESASLQALLVRLGRSSKLETV